jgi:Asp-tRNA(Asn)/Glu-tRNA(Gln) amidotransferase A subunit family amidase
MIPTFLAFDTPCVFERDIRRFKDFVNVWYNPPISHRNRPFKVVYPLGYFPGESQEQMQHIDPFVKDLEAFLDIQVFRLSISETWRRITPHEAGGQHLHEYLNYVVVYIYYHDFDGSTNEFRSRYYTKHGEMLYVNSFVKWRWNLGKQVTDTEYEVGMHRLKVYKNWFLKTVMEIDQKNTIVILPIANIMPNYRNTPPTSPVIQTGFDPLYLFPTLGAPDIVVPIGETSYESRITGVNEMLPICVTLVGSVNSDLHLIKITQAFLGGSGRAIIAPQVLKCFNSIAF